jgi:DNA mismatch repair ATPase MutS
MTDETNFGKYSLHKFDFTQYYMRLDSAASAALHLTSYGAEVSTMVTSKAGDSPRTIAAQLNKCQTSGGQQLLAQWIKHPLQIKVSVGIKFKSNTSYF